MYRVVGFDAVHQMHFLLDMAGNVEHFCISDFYHFFCLPEEYLHSVSYRRSG